MTPFPCFVEKHGRGFFHLPKQGLCLQPKPTGRQAALYLFIYRCAVATIPAVPATCISPCFYGLVPFSFYTRHTRLPRPGIISGSLSLRTSVHWSDPHKEGRRMHVVLGWHTGTSALLKQPRMPAHCQQASSFVCPAGDCLTHPKPEYCYSPVLSTNPFIQRSTFYTGLMPLYFLSQLRVISLQN